VNKNFSYRPILAFTTFNPSGLIRFRPHVWQKQVFAGRHSTLEPSASLVFVLCVLDAGKVLATMRSCCASDVNAAVGSARDAFRTWSQLSGMQRGKLLSKAAHILRVSLPHYVWISQLLPCCSHLCSSLSVKWDFFWIIGAILALPFSGKQW